MKFKTIAALVIALLVSVSAMAGTLSLRGGGRGLGDTPGKLVGLSWTASMPEALDAPSWLVWQAEAGTWTTSNYFRGSYSGYASLQAGIELLPPYTYLRVVNGPAWISRTDDRLGTHFQFHTSASVGVRVKGVRLGITYSHFSNGGIGSPNRGRDYGMLDVAFEF